MKKILLFFIILYSCAEEPKKEKEDSIKYICQTKKLINGTWESDSGEKIEFFDIKYIAYRNLIKSKGVIWSVRSDDGYILEDYIGPEYVKENPKKGLKIMRTDDIDYCDIGGRFGFSLEGARNVYYGSMIVSEVRSNRPMTRAIMIENYSSYTYIDYTKHKEIYYQKIEK